MTLLAPTTTVSLTDDIIFSIKIRTYSGMKSNNKKAAEYSANEGAKRKVLGVSEDLFVDDANLRAIRNHRQNVDNWAARLGAPWGNKDYYLPGMLHPELIKGFDQRHAEFEALIDKWLGTEAEYNQRISDFAFQRGKLFDRSQYPSYTEVRKRFSMELFISPVPVNHVISQKFADLSSDLHNHYQRQHQRQLQSVMGKLSADMLSVLTRLSKSTTDVTVTDKNGKMRLKHGRVFESTLDLANHIIQTFKDFNLTADPALETARLGLEHAMRGVTVDNLRTGQSLRVAVKNSVDDLLRAFAPSAVQNIAKSGLDTTELGQDEDFEMPDLNWTAEDEHKAEIEAERHYEEMPLSPVSEDVEQDFLSLLGNLDEIETDDAEPTPEPDLTLPAQEADSGDVFALFGVTA